MSENPSIQDTPSVNQPVEPAPVGETESRQSVPTQVEPPVAAVEPACVTAKMMYQTCVVVALVCSLLSVYIYHSFFALRVATMDLPGYMMQLRDAVAGGRMSGDQVVTAVGAVADIAKNVPARYVLISGDVILGDAKKVMKVPLPALPAAAQSSNGGQMQLTQPMQQQPAQGNNIGNFGVPNAR